MYNKIDVCSMEEVDEIARRPHSIPISCYQKLNFDGLLARIWSMMVGGAARSAVAGWRTAALGAAGSAPRASLPAGPRVLQLQPAR